MSPYRTVNVKKLTPGDTLGEPVFSEGLTKLLGSGCAVSEQLIKRLAERGVTEVVVQIPALPAEKHQRHRSVPVNVRPENIIDASRHVEHSCQCGNVIAIQAPAADLPVATWICKTCGAAYFGGVNSTKNRGVELLAANDRSQVGGDDQTEAIDESTSKKTDVNERTRNRVGWKGAEATNTLFDGRASGSCPIAGRLQHRRPSPANDDTGHFPKRHRLSSCSF